MAYKSKYSGLQIDDILDSVGSKQDKIDDLTSIRAGAAKGATALQSYTEKYTGTVTGIKINGETKSGSGVIDLGTISTDISGKVDKVDGKQLSTEDFTTALKTKLEGLNNYDDTELSNAVETLRGDFDEIVSGDTTTAIKTFNEVIAFLDGITDTQDLESIIASIEQQIAGKMDKVTLATVATSGSYNDLSNKPTIPAAVTESTVSGWGFTKNTGTYSKPSSGIPKSDLASAVQTSLGKADTALQSYTEQYKGTVTKVKINGSEKSPDSNGLVDLGTIEGGGGSGEDIRYFTDFTVEDIIEASATNSSVIGNYNKLKIAAANNNLICIPYENTDTGYVIASYSYKEYSDYSTINVRLEYNGNVYMLYESDSYSFIADYPRNLSGSIVELQIDDYAQIEVKDNTFYSLSVEGEFKGLVLGVFNALHKGSTIRFFSSYWVDTSGDVLPPRLEVHGSGLLWPNGVVPEIEIDTWYELSLTTSSDGLCCLAVLTPFKPVE